MNISNESLLNAIFESTGDGLLIVDSEGQIVRFNSRFQQLWKIPEQILITKDDDKVISFILNQLDDPATFLKKVKDLYSDPEATSFDQIKFKDGRFFERYSRPLKVTEETVGRIWSFRDISEQKKSQEVFKTVTSLSPDIISIIGPTGTLLFNSEAAERIHGYTKEELVGINTLDFIHSEDREVVFKEMERLTTEPDYIASVQYRYRNKDGSYVWMEATGSNHLLNPLINGLVTISREINKRKKLEQDLSSAINLRDEFISVASHELKTPMASIKLQVQMLLKEFKKNPDYVVNIKAVNRLLESSQTLQLLIESLLNDSQIRTGHFSLHPEQVDISSSIHKIIDQLSILFSESKSRLILKIQDNVMANVDKSKMEQVFTNLLSNVLKYAPGTDVEIELNKANGMIFFRISDHGPGISMDKHALIFNRFERTENLHHSTGLGLGLYITKKIIEDHGGTIRVESQEGKGATFLITLPEKSGQ